jgi:hypothetical protein
MTSVHNWMLCLTSRRSGRGSFALQVGVASLCERRAAEATLSNQLADRGAFRSQSSTMKYLRLRRSY